jgi:hypothetical protein
LAPAWVLILETPMLVFVLVSRILDQKKLNAFNDLVGQFNAQGRQSIFRMNRSKSPIKLVKSKGSIGPF